jgi:hypothetical protein
MLGQPAPLGFLGLDAIWMFLQARTCELDQVQHRPSSVSQQTHQRVLGPVLDAEVGEPLRAGRGSDGG